MAGDNAKPRVCKDCAPRDKPLAAPYPGPRCFSHHHARKRQTKAASHDRRSQRVYGLEPGEYEKIYAAQGGVCALCRRAKGISKKLAVDHDHSTGLVRGLLCSTCNQIVGHARNDPEFFRRGAAYLDDARRRNESQAAMFA